MKVARVKASELYDVENDMMIATVLGKYRASERLKAEELINQLEDIGFSNNLILLDRGYPFRLSH